eukprot:UN09585
MFFDCIFRAFLPKKNGENWSEGVKFVPKCSERYEAFTRDVWKLKGA